MKSLNIYPNPKSVRAEAKFFFWVIVAIGAILGAIFLFQHESSASQNSKYKNILMVILGLYAGLLIFTEVLRMNRFSKLNGPVLTLSPDGVTDHLYLKRKLAWDEIKYLGSRRSSGRNTYEYFVIHPANPTWQYWLKRLYSYPLKYKLTRLSVPDPSTPDVGGNREIVTSKPLNKKRVSGFLKEFAPWNIRRKKKGKLAKFEKFSPYVFWGGCLILLFWIHVLPRLS